MQCLIRKKYFLEVTVTLLENFDPRFYIPTFKRGFIEGYRLVAEQFIDAKLAIK